ncbi:hypothetical protein BYT27DRAFT_7198634 [Phlegmacium glaucopus]|nr:hypothetical protein BYT27DRAFT_7198634 [Phlegmacium glaucopus]
MSNERPSKNNRMTKGFRYIKGKFSSRLPSTHPPTSLSVDVDPSLDNCNVTIDAETSNMPPKMVPVVSVDHAAPTVVAAEADTKSLPNSVPVSPSIPSVPRQLGSSSRPRPETPFTHMAPNTHSPMSAFQGAHNVRLYHSTINIADSIHMHVPCDADGNEQPANFRTSNTVPKLVTATSEQPVKLTGSFFFPT